MDDQSCVIAFLRSPELNATKDATDVLDTHGAFVFLAGPYAYKIKRAVRYDYMDFSTVELRRKALEREFTINRPAAPDIYLDLLPIARAADGALHLGGTGETVEWVLKMRRFDQADLLSAVADRGELTVGLGRELADVVRGSHGEAAALPTPDADAHVGRIADNLMHGLREVEHLLAPFNVDAFERLVAAQMARARDCLRRRGTTGAVARCHGDLHLGNIVMWRGQPTLFDALEFDESLATIDKLYDLAFLLMDLDHRGHRDIANAVLNRYLAPAAAVADIHGLVAMPLFLGLRSAIRALVTTQRAMLENPGPEQERDLYAARSSAAHALSYLAPAPPRLVAVGGLSGTGKSTLAAALAPDLLPIPGALHIRTDVERKAMFGVAETDRLPASAYEREVTERVYGMMLDRARAALAAGQSAIMDAVFARPEERTAAQEVATTAGVTFDGLWLTAPRTVLLDRVAARTNDASDATPEVVERQFHYGHGEPLGWIAIESGGAATITLAAARAALEPRAVNPDRPRP